jgi:hypothetical protein
VGEKGSSFALAGSPWVVLRARIDRGHMRVSARDHHGRRSRSTDERAGRHGARITGTGDRAPQLVFDADLDTLIQTGVDEAAVRPTSALAVFVDRVDRI